MQEPNKTWERTKEEQKRSREERASERALQASGSYNTPQANTSAAASPSSPKKGKREEMFHSPLHFNAVDESDSHEGWISPLPAKKSLTTKIEHAHQEALQQAQAEFPTPATPPSVMRYLARVRTPNSSAFKFDAELTPEQPDACVTAIQSVKAFIKNAIETERFDCTEALTLLNREKTNVTQAMNTLPEDDHASREVYGEFIANAAFMIQRINDRQEHQQAVSNDDMMQFINIMAPPRQEVAVRLF